MNRKYIWSLVINALIVLTETVGFIIAIGNNGIAIMGYYTQESNLVLLLASLVWLIETVRKKGRISYGAALFKYIAVCMTAVTFTVVVVCFVPMCLPSMGLKAAIYAMLLRDASLYHHLICPLLAIVSYLFLEGGRSDSLTGSQADARADAGADSQAASPEYVMADRRTNGADKKRAGAGTGTNMLPGSRESFYAMLPTLAYAIVSTSLNVLKVVRGPYPFLYVYEQPVWASVLWFFAIPGGGWLFARLVARLKRKAA